MAVRQRFTGGLPRIAGRSGADHATGGRETAPGFDGRETTARAEATA
ncbi:hypothetical protein [Micromonospora sp. RTP1Z1]|nr:hypothetical protein [Micromonospora sp. RTP1Z1]